MDKSSTGRLYLTEQSNKVVDTTVSSESIKLSLPHYIIPVDIFMTSNSVESVYFMIK